MEENKEFNNDIGEVITQEDGTAAFKFNRKQLEKIFNMYGNKIKPEDKKKDLHTKKKKKKKQAKKSRKINRK